LVGVATDNQLIFSCRGSDKLLDQSVWTRLLRVNAR
jgi:hypothetical protein